MCPIPTLPSALFLVAATCFAKPPETSPRVTDTVHIVRKTEPAVVAVFSQAEGRLSMGSGSVVHKDGYVLTNDHVVNGMSGVVLLRDHPHPLQYEIIGRMPEKDLCLLRVRTSKPLDFMRLGRSKDLMTGEPVLCAGNPGGRGIVYSSGIVSSPSFILSAPNALVMRSFSGDVRDRFIQFDAASNLGNSGGPLINALSEQIGVVSNKNPDEENINFAIPIDRVRVSLNELFAPEVRQGVFTGINLDPLSQWAKISKVAIKSPAAKLGLRSGDILKGVDGRPLDSCLDWFTHLLGQKVGDELKLSVSQGKKNKEVTLKLSKYPTPALIDIKKPKPGLLFEVCHGTFEKAPSMEKQKIVKTGVAWALDVLTMGAPKTDDFAIKLEGALKIPNNGVYRLILNSDDGSILRTGKEILVDNDGPHPAQDVGTLLRLKKGFLPIRIDYFQATGDAELSLFIENSSGQRSDAAHLFFHEDTKKTR
jgi:S1-C subfamily serine protease